MDHQDYYKADHIKFANEETKLNFAKMKDGRDLIQCPTPGCDGKSLNHCQIFNCKCVLQKVILSF